MRPISRRAALTLGGLGLVSVAVGGTGLIRQLESSMVAHAPGGPYVEPPVLRGRGGWLVVRLEASLGTHEVAGRQARTLGYNSGVPGPTLLLRPGDTLRVDLVNRLEGVTNLHVHGLHVSPEGNGDNVFVGVEPGETRSYEYRLPVDHPPGVYWYHPHHHGHVADQVFGGLYGAIVVESASDEVGADRERLMMVSDMTLDRAGSLVTPSTMDQVMGREGELVLLNGQIAPRLEGRAGERERWRLVNACTARYLALVLPGQDVRVLGRDRGRLAQTVGLGDVLLAPGNRLDVVVDLREGSSELVAQPVARGGLMGAMAPGGRAPGADGPVALARLEVGSGEVSRHPQLPPGPTLQDLRTAEVARRRSITFQMGMGSMMAGGAGPMVFTFDGLEFDADRIDQDVRLGSVEEWTIGNDSPLDHPFHLHVWPMQLVEVSGQQVRDPLWLDVVNVPARSQVKVLVAFDDFGGKTAYHCHILDHEDRGMMGTVLAR